MTNLLSRVVVSPDVLYACLSHALCTEHQEIMGLLLGKYENNEAFIARSMVLNRKDKKKDRVEVSNNDLVVASTIAEDLSLTVIGWYHSHPHITVMPSHVDVKTQGQYQGLGNFLGLIFSAFDKGRMEMCAFQSRKRKGDWERVEIPVVVSNEWNYSSSLLSNNRLLESLIAMQLVLINEDRETFDNVMKVNRKSYLDISRSLSVYQGGLYRLIDLQLCPLLMAMKSKVSSLQCEKEKLLDRLKKLSLGNKNKKDTNDNVKEMNDDEFMNYLSSNNDTSKDINRPNIDRGDHKESNLEQSKTNLKTFEKTMPKWNLSMTALKIAFAGMTCEFISFKPECKKERNIRIPQYRALKGFNKGNEYTVIIKRTVIPPISFPCVSDISSPWSIVFESNETETEDEFVNIINGHLIKVDFSSINGCIDFTVLLPGNLQNSAQDISQTDRANEPPKNDSHLIAITVKILSCSQHSITQRACHVIIGENLHSALRLHLWPSN